MQLLCRGGHHLLGRRMLRAAHLDGVRDRRRGCAGVFGQFLRPRSREQHFLLRAVFLDVPRAHPEVAQEAKHPQRVHEHDVRIVRRVPVKPPEKLKVEKTQLRRFRFRLSRQRIFP